MTLDEAIKHCEEVAKEKEHDAKSWNRTAKFWGSDKRYAINQVNECTRCAEEHYRVAEWLKELKQYRNLFDSPKDAEEMMNMYMV